MALTNLTTPPAPVPAPAVGPAIQLSPGGPTEPATFFFADSTYGWLWRGGTFVATADGGKSWIALPDLGGPVLSLDFLTPYSGWAATTQGLLNTRDGGLSWAAALDAPAGVNRVIFIDASNGWAGTMAQLVRTLDGGRTWAAATQPCSNAAGPGPFSFIDADTGWMLCFSQAATMMEDKRLFVTRDGGMTWAIVAATPDQTLPSPAADRLPSTGHVRPVGRQLFFSDSHHGWFVLDRAGRLYATTDGGTTWSAHQVVGEDSDSLRDVEFVSPGHGYLLVRDILFATGDGAGTWQQIYPL